MHAEVQAEVAFKVSLGARQLTLAQMDAELRQIGYRLDRDGDCKSRNRYVTGERAGCGYPAVNMRAVQVSDGKSFAHFESRRDENFKRLQAMRDEVFAVSANQIYEI